MRHSAAAARPVGIVTLENCRTTGARRNAQFSSRGECKLRLVRTGHSQPRRAGFLVMNPRLVRAERGVLRRVFLKSIALGLSVPIAMKLSRLATASPTPAPKRLFVFFMPHGVAPEHYNPRVTEGNWREFALDQTNESILGPLEPFRSEEHTSELQSRENLVCRLLL